jgi:hypothetical protein
MSLLIATPSASSMNIYGKQGYMRGKAIHISPIFHDFTNPGFTLFRLFALYPEDQY